MVAAFPAAAELKGVNGLRVRHNRPNRQQTTPKTRKRKTTTTSAISIVFCWSVSNKKTDCSFSSFSEHLSPSKIAVAGTKMLMKSIKRALRFDARVLGLLCVQIPDLSTARLFGASSVECPTTLSA